MRDALGPGTMLGYCTNVHAGATWDQTRASLLEHAARVRQLVSPDAPMGVGLWLSASSARELLASGGVRDAADLLAGHGLLAYTINGFPFGDFHEPVVKHRAYRPDWAEPARLAYTRDLAEILDRMLAPGETGSISTLPVGWSSIAGDAGRLERARANLLAMARTLRDLERERGRLIHVDLEPEPGCHLDRARHVVTLFDELRAEADDDLDVTRYLRVCHDVCHAAVMFEDQREIVDLYDAAGIAVGKVQVSSAVRAAFDELAPGDRAAAVRQLAAFDERRYLHQTVVRDTRARDLPRFFDDLPGALAARGADPAGEWRVHFHVPIDIDAFGHLATTRPAIRECLELLGGRVEHWEVETYAWDVLPAPMRVATLAEGIGRELAWMRDEAAAVARR